MAPKQRAAGMAAGWWLQAVLVLAVTVHAGNASPNATIANGSDNERLSKDNYNASIGSSSSSRGSNDDLITPVEINEGLLLEYAAGPLSREAMDAAKPKHGNPRPAAIYMNEFAVYIPRGVDVADSIAHKYGFSNLGQPYRLSKNTFSGSPAVTPQVGGMRQARRSTVDLANRLMVV
uniref:Peptidase S8 pro-domain domain-containing protein n=1 Tax=Anopheles farauti TaxID=69004 RepID=A0A182QVN1_9DIPT